MGKAARVKRALREGQAGVRVVYTDGDFDLDIFRTEAAAAVFAEGVRKLMPDEPAIAQVEVLDAAAIRDLVQRHGR